MDKLICLIIIILIIIWWQTTREPFTSIDQPLIENADLSLQKGPEFVNPRVDVRAPTPDNPRNTYEANSRMIASSSPDKIYWQTMGGYWM